MPHALKNSLWHSYFLKQKILIDLPIANILERSARANWNPPKCFKAKNGTKNLEKAQKPGELKIKKQAKNISQHQHNFEVS